MRTRVLTLTLAALLAARPAPAEEPAPPPTPKAPAVTLPKAATAPPGRLLRLTAETTCPQVRWLLASEDADLIPFPDGKTALFSAPRPGRYLVFAWTAAGDVPSEAARCVVTVGDPAPPRPPDPPPGPPPAPNPLRERLRKAFDADPGTEPVKSESRRYLAELYRQGAVFAQSAEVKTAEALVAKLKAAGSNLTGDTLPGTRKAIAAELAEAFPDDAPLTDADRLRAATLFRSLAEALSW